MRILIALFVCGAWVAQASDLDDALGVLATPAIDGTNSPELSTACRVLAAASVDELPRILDAMPDDNKLAQNWIRSGADAAIERASSEGIAMPLAQWRQYCLDTTRPAQARRVAFEWIERHDATMALGLLPKFLNDANLELRYEAVAQLIESAENATDETYKRQMYRRAFESARELSQLSECAAKLETLGVEVDIVDQLGYITSWQLIGPFDNVGGVGFDTVYAPETPTDDQASYEGKNREVSWQPIESDAPMGLVDIADAMNNEKGAVAYVKATIKSSKAMPADIRYLTQNASKLWLNGQPVAEFEVYHAGGEGDQYIVPVDLRQGTNTILLKLCQNEQTEPWAQSWSFALRLCDRLGGKLTGVPESIEK
jgi:hypothetical protein